MPQPLNYMSVYGQPTGQNPFQQGLQTGAALQEVTLKREAADTAEKLRTEYATDLQATLANPTAEKFANLTLKYPQQREAFKQSWDTLDKVQQDNEFLVGAQAFNAINVGKIDVAKKLIDDQITAATNSGKPTVKLEAMRKTLDENPKLVQGQLGLILSTVNPGKWLKIAAESRAAEAAPFELSKKRSESIVAEAEARFTPAKLAADLQLSQGKLGEAARAKAADLESARSNMDNMLNTATRILNTPIGVISQATGPISSRMPTLAQDTADLEALVETLGSQAFLAQIPNIKGMGALSNAEGDKLQAALQNFSLKQSPKRFIENVNEAQRLVMKARNNMTARYGSPETAPDIPAASTANVGGKTYNRPANFTDAQWSAYKQSVGAK